MLLSKIQRATRNKFAAKSVNQKHLHPTTKNIGGRRVDQTALRKGNTPPSVECSRHRRRLGSNVDDASCSNIAEEILVPELLL